MNPKLPPGVTIKDGRYYRIQYLGVIDGRRRQKWHKLTRVDAGMAAMFAALAKLAQSGPGEDTAMPTRITAWLQHALPGLSFAEQKEITRMAGEVSEAFAEFDTTQVQARHILAFLQQWSRAGKLRTAQRYRALLIKFFKWVIVQGDRADNPVEPVSTKPPPHNSFVMPSSAFMAIRAKLLGGDKHAAPSGPMMQCAVDLIYLTGQRPTEIRLLRWTKVDEAAGLIHFAPTKTAKSSAAKVDWPITPAIAKVLARAKQIMRDRSRMSPYVIHTMQGSAYTAHGLNSAWSDARIRAGIKGPGYTLKNIRPKHATDAKKQGYTDEQIQPGLAHVDVEMTRTYIKQREAAVGVVELELPDEMSGGDETGRL